MQRALVRVRATARVRASVSVRIRFRVRVGVEVGARVGVRVRGLGRCSAPRSLICNLVSLCAWSPGQRSA